MSRNNNRRRGGNNSNNKNRGAQNQAKAERAPATVQKSENAKNGNVKMSNGLFDFSEEELAEDRALQVISRAAVETKYANFEEFLKDH